ncbi:hypothetical protein [Tahibacter amnicola]|uniref:Beta-galactosidase-like protein n=1 Tax=Tahibacter amnicola TaxID=2976241 RepID=A0ABY6B7W9_9GAMM|nr:hypothetical protein [Tahibacter amnicola]UXI65867.1 hypothetical protein N4264_13980 [Tahibacter amnicola]
MNRLSARLVVAAAFGFAPFALPAATTVEDRIFAGRFECVAGCRFHFLAEISGNDPAPWAAVLATWYGFNGFGFWAPLSAASQAYIASSPFALSAYMPAANRDMPSYGYDWDPENIPTLEAQLRSLADASAEQGRIVWNGMAEFDQGGGDWAQGRPPPSAALTREQNYVRYRDFYLHTLGMGGVLGRTPEQRGYVFAAVADFPWTAHWAYDWGADLVMGERIIDELSGIVPGMSFYRGAGTQHGKAWGFDFSTWRYWTDSPTEYDAQDRLTGGWSASWFERHLYLAYMGGADVVHMEPAEYFNPSGAPNPLGATVGEFAAFAIDRHPVRPRSHVPFALMIDPYSGFDPKFGEYLQGDGVWYGQLPYADSDHLIDNLLQLAYPGHERHGTLVPGGPQNVAEYRARLAAGEDPRPWEPMGTSRWGDVFDILTTTASTPALVRHRVLALATAQAMTPALRDRVRRFVAAGGVLVINAAQVAPDDASLSGVELTGVTAQSNNSVWLGDGTGFGEPTYRYAKVALQGAAVVARNAAGDPLITRYAIGSGEVYLVTPILFQDDARQQILGIVGKLFDVLAARYAPAAVEGPPALYQLNADDRHTTVALYNGAGSVWSGAVRFPRPTGAFRTVEWRSDASVPHQVDANTLLVPASVPPYGVRIYALERLP